MSRWLGMLLATIALGACPSSPKLPPQVPVIVDDTAVRLRIARAESLRGGGVAELVELAQHRDAATRALALRGLGRIGGAAATKALTGALTDPTPGVVAAAATGLGVIGLLDEPPANPAIELLAALARVPDPSKPAVIEAIGRTGDASAQIQLRDSLGSASGDEVRAAAALAMGRFGRRKIELDPSIKQALIELATKQSGAVGYAAVYALAREHQPEVTDGVGPALAARLADENPETRALAAAAAARQNVVGSVHAQLERALIDTDWRVAVEAVRALAGDKGDDAGRDAVAAALVRRFTELERGVATEAQVVIEGLRVLGPHAKRPLVMSANAALASIAATASKSKGLAYDWIACLGAAASIRAAHTPEIATFANCRLPAHLAMPILADLVTAGVGPVAPRRAAVARSLVHADVRVRAAGIGALPSLWKEGSAVDHRAAIATLVGAIGSKDPILAGSAIDAATALYEAIGDGEHAELDAAVIARASTERDPELAAAILELVGKRKLATGAAACRAALGLARVVAAAGRKCLAALGEPPPDAASVPLATPPPVDVAPMINRNLEWTLETSRGEIVIALDPDAAPWAVAAVAMLTQRGFYDGLEFHRVVPNFVVQGGDPTQSGWGGPGFTLPSEPTEGKYVVGGVGIADAGRDSGGSQWFVMHGRSPHLDGRYTWIGKVIRGQKSADALLIGDRVTRATINVTPRAIALPERRRGG